MRNQAKELEGEAGARTAETACRLFSSISHEIRTPMNGILGMLALLLETGLSDEQRTLAATAQSSAEELFQLTSDILDLSMLHGETFELKYASFDLQKLLDAAARSALTGAPDSAPHPQVQPTITPGTLTGDSRCIQRIVAILAGRAIACSTDGAVRLDTAFSGTGRNRTLRVSASAVTSFPKDSHIPAQTASHKYGKSELEWALAQQLVQVMGGTIGLERAADGTIAFWCTLQLEVEPAAVTGMRVLFVGAQQDLHAAVMAPVMASIMAQGARAERCHSAGSALAALATSAAAGDACRILICSRQLPDIDGASFGAALKSDPAYRELVVVMLDDALENAPEEIPARAEQSVFAARLALPCTEPALLDVIQQLAHALRNGQPAHCIAKLSAGTAGTVAQSFRGYRILVADDNRVNREVAVRMARNLGCSADAASDGRIAVAMHRAQPYDLILMDCQMPELDGFEACAQIRVQESAGSHTPIIGWTAHVMSGEQDACAVAGMDDFLVKPLRPAVLHEVLERWLRRPLQSTEPPAAQAEPEDDLESVREMFGEDFAELVMLFRADSPGRLAAMQEAAHARDAAALAKVVHTLSGSTASIGAARLAAQCRDLEIAARAGLPPDISARLAAIESAYATIDARLQAMLGG